MFKSEHSEKIQNQKRIRTVVLFSILDNRQNRIEEKYQVHQPTMRLDLFLHRLQPAFSYDETLRQYFVSFNEDLTERELLSGHPTRKPAKDKVCVPTVVGLQVRFLHPRLRKSSKKGHSATSVVRQRR